jgi:hypothetical protein
VPAHLDVHVVLDNSSTHKTPSIQRRLAGEILDSLAAYCQRINDSGH